jgi:capsular exopolysaccharide synthesis family protein
MASFRSRKTKPEGEQSPGLGEDMVVIVDRAVNPYLVLFHDPAGFRAEQVRGLRNRLQAMNPDGDAKTLVVTSAARADGRTTTAINLAMALAELERHEVVLVDADLRHPGIERLLNLPPAPGLSDVLLGRVPLERALRPAGFRRLMLLGGGTKVQNPAEVLSGSRIDEIYARLKERFQYVVVDTPPALASTDAGMLAARADGTLIVLRLEHTTRGHAKDAFRNLQDLGANVLGSFVIEVRGADPEADRRLGYHDGEDLP